MRWIPLLSRIAFICNLMFLFCILLQWKLFISNQVLLSTILTIGFFLAPFIFSPVVNLFYLAILLQKKSISTVVPKWLAVSNFIFLLLQAIFVLFFLYDSLFS